MAKRFVIAVIIMTLFGIFVLNFGRWNELTHALSAVVPAQSAAPAAPRAVTSVPSPSPTSKTAAPAQLADPRGGRIEASQITSALDALKSPESGSDVPKYVRAKFGPAWSDVDHSGCDTRNDVLKSSLTQVTFRPGTHDCVVIIGTLDDPFTGKTIHFLKAQASKIQIDHMVPLSWAWQNGAWAWTDEQRLAYANNPANLTAVAGAANQQKSDSGPSAWRPSNDAYTCTYVERFVYIASIYKLTIGDSDRAASRRILASCK